MSTNLLKAAQELGAGKNERKDGDFIKFKVMKVSPVTCNTLMETQSPSTALTMALHGSASDAKNAYVVLEYVTAGGEEHCNRHSVYIGGMCMEARGVSR